MISCGKRYLDDPNVRSRSEITSCKRGLTDCSTYMQAGWLAYMLYSTARKHELRVGYQPEGRQK